MAVVWRTRALTDIARLVRYIAADNAIAAARVARELLLGGDSLVPFLRRGHLGRQPDIRELVAIRLDIIVYRLTGWGDIIIPCVWHGAITDADNIPLVAAA